MRDILTELLFAGQRKVNPSTIHVMIKTLAMLLLFAASAHADLKTVLKSERICESDFPGVRLIVNRYSLLDGGDASMKVNPEVLRVVHLGQGNSKKEALSACSKTGTNTKVTGKLEVNAQLEEAPGNLIWLGATSDSEGGAHPTRTVKSYFFSRSSGQSIPVTGLFTSKGLSEVDGYVREALDRYFHDHSEAEMCQATDFTSLAEKGAIHFDGPEMVVRFSDYEVGAYACGRVEVRIGMAKVRPYLARH